MYTLTAAQCWSLLYHQISTFWKCKCLCILECKQAFKIIRKLWYPKGQKVFKGNDSRHNWFCTLQRLWRLKYFVSRKITKSLKWNATKTSCCMGFHCHACQTTDLDNNSMKSLPDWEMLLSTPRNNGSSKLHACNGARQASALCTP
jgi:hypothetical protein